MLSKSRKLRMLRPLIEGSLPLRTCRPLFSISILFKLFLQVGIPLSSLVHARVMYILEYTRTAANMPISVRDIALMMIVYKARDSG